MPTTPSSRAAPRVMVAFMPCSAARTADRRISPGFLPSPAPFSSAWTSGSSALIKPVDSPAESRGRNRGVPQSDHIVVHLQEGDRAPLHLEGCYVGVDEVPDDRDTSRFADSVELPVHGSELRNRLSTHAVHEGENAVPRPMGALVNRTSFQPLPSASRSVLLSLPGTPCMPIPSSKVGLPLSGTTHEVSAMPMLRSLRFTLPHRPASALSSYPASAAAPQIFSARTVVPTPRLRQAPLPRASDRESERRTPLPGTRRRASPSRQTRCGAARGRSPRPRRSPSSPSRGRRLEVNLEQPGIRQRQTFEAFTNHGFRPVDQLFHTYLPLPFPMIRRAVKRCQGNPR